jgi:hypothetical protein
VNDPNGARRDKMPPKENREIFCRWSTRTANWTLSCESYSWLMKRPGQIRELGEAKAPFDKLRAGTRLEPTIGNAVRREKAF